MSLLVRLAWLGEPKLAYRWLLRGCCWNLWQYQFGLLARSLIKADLYVLIGDGGFY